MGATVSMPLAFLSTRLNINLSSRIEEGGFCSKDEGALETGAKITTALSIELWLEVYAEFLKKRRNLFSHRFFNLTKTLDEECAPLSIEDFKSDPAQSDTALLEIPTALVTPLPGHPQHHL